MPITREQVEYVAHLSRLELSKQQKDMFAHQLDEILAYVEKLSELDTEHVEPLVHVAEKYNVFREDAAGEPLPQQEALSNAPEQSEGYFKVPRIIE